MQGLVQLKDKFKEGDVVVVILHDHGSRYMGKIYNDDWMRDRGFLTDEVVTAKNIADRKSINQLVYAVPNETVASAFKKMKEMNLTQLPVMDGENNLGSITEHSILQLLMENPYHREDEVGKVMSKPFPFVPLTATATEISKHISKDNTAVLVKLNSGAFTIITEFDLIEAMA